MGFAVWMGVFARQYSFNHPSVVADYAGDTFWALAVFGAVGLLFSAIPSWQAGSGAFVIPAILKLSQLYHLPWVDSIEGTQIGYLVLGTDFLTTDLACYAAGAVVGMTLEFLILD
jgi:hypothetical protein